MFVPWVALEKRPCFMANKVDYEEIGNNNEVHKIHKRGIKNKGGTNQKLTANYE